MKLKIISNYLLTFVLFYFMLFYFNFLLQFFTIKIKNLFKIIYELYELILVFNHFYNKD